MTLAGQEYKRPETLDGARQLVHWAAHAAATCRNFVVSKMNNLPSLTFSRNIKTSNVHSDGNKKFVEDGKELKNKRAVAGNLTEQSDHQARVLTKNLAHSTMLLLESSAGPEVSELRILMTAKTWDLRNKATDEKGAAAKHFPMKLLQSMRIAHTTNTSVKAMSRKYLGWVRQLYSYLGRSKMNKDDGNDLKKTGAYYQGVTDRLSFLQSGVFLSVCRPWAADDATCGNFVWLLPKGKPGCGFYRTLTVKTGSTAAKRKRPRKTAQKTGKRKRAAKADDIGGKKLQKSATLGEEFDVDFIVEGPRPSDAKFRIRWVGWDNPDDDTWEPASNFCPELLAEYLAKEEGEGSDSEGDDLPLFLSLCNN